MADTLKLITDRESELGGLYARMDKDRDAVRLKKYVLTGFDLYKDKEIPRTVSVTMNEPAVFADAISSILQGAKSQTTVEGLSDKANKVVENFINDCLYTIDQQLRRRRIASLRAWLSDQVCIRGPICSRVTFKANGLPNCVPIDTRNYSFVDGEWGCNRTFRKRSELAKEDWYADARLPVGENIKVEVRDYWDTKVNEIWIDKAKVFDQENVYRVVPDILNVPRAGFYMQDEDYEQYWAESIFFLVRDLYPEWNRLMSIQQTKALEWVKPPYAHQVKDLTQAQPQDYPHKIGTNTPYAEGEEPHLLQTNDETRAFQGAEQGMSNAIHKGSANITDLADIGGMRNAAWITGQTEIRNKILLPRTECIQSFYQDFAYLLIKEYQAHDFAESPKLGRRENKNSYSASDLGDPDTCTIEFRIMPDNTRQKLANYTVGIALRGTLSEDTIIRDIYQCDDPDGEIDKLRAEEARKSNPIIFYYDMSYSLCDVAKNKTGDDKKRLLRKAKLAADSMVDAIKKQKMSSVDQPGTQQMQLPKANGQAMLAMPSLVGGGQND
jgi:hypothetical protein